MKKTLSIFLALIIAGLCFLPVFAQDIQTGMAKYKIGEGVYYLPENVKAIEEGDFDGLNARVVLITSETIDISESSGLNDAVIILPDSAVASNSFDAKFYADKAAKNWFAYDIFKIFGNTFLTFLYYDSEVDNFVWNEDVCCWYDELRKDVDPDYVYFRYEDLGSSFYISGSASGAELAKGEGVEVNPFFLSKMILNFCLSELETKDFYGKHPGGKGGNFLVSLLRSLFR